MFEDDFDDEFEGFNPFRAQKELMTLSELTADQCFLCDQCGSGEPIKPLHYKNVYSRMINMQTGEGAEQFVMSMSLLAVKLIYPSGMNQLMTTLKLIKNIIQLLRNKHK